MADLIFLDHHIRPRPAKKHIASWAERAETGWWSGPTAKVVDEMGDFFGASDHYLTLTGGLQAAHLQVLQTHYVDVVRQTGRTNIITVECEQSSILEGVKHLEKFEVRGTFLPLEKLSAEDFRQALRPRTSLLSISWAHPLTGVIQPIGELIAICKQQDVKVHLDVSAAVGKLHFDLSELDVDYLTLDGGMLQLPVQMGVIFSKEKMLGAEPFPFPYYAALRDGLKKGMESIDAYSMEVGYLRNLLEERLIEAGARVLYQEIERLPNTSVVELPGIHGEKGVEILKKHGIFASKFSKKPSVVCFALSDSTTKKEIERTAAVFAEELTGFKKDPFLPFSEEDARAKGMRVASGVAESYGLQILLSLLVDEEDGVIADSRVNAYGPSSFEKLAKFASGLLLRKTYMQARRLSADLIEREAKGEAKSTHLNLIIDGIDSATESCFDIPIEDIYTAPPDMGRGERTVYPGWEELTDVQKKSVISEVMQSDIVPYVELDAGGVEVTKVEGNRVTIVYSGNCTSCFSATGATLDAIGNILRHKIYPDLMVIPDLSLEPV